MDNELDGLKAIYPCVTVVNDKTIDLDIYPYWSEEDSEEHLVSITITVSEGYPEEPPHVRIFALWMKDIVSSLRFAEQAVREAWVAGQPSLFPIIQYIQDNIPQPDQPGPVVGGSIPPPVGTGPPNKLVEETIKIYTGNPIVDKKSIFQAFACRVYSKEDVDLFTQTMYQRPKTRRATHNIVAYRFTVS